MGRKGSGENARSLEPRKASLEGGREKGKEQGTAVEIKNGKNMRHRGDCDHGGKSVAGSGAKDTETLNRAELSQMRFVIRKSKVTLSLWKWHCG